MRSASASTANRHAAVQVIASGCAPPIPPRPAVRVIVPASEPSKRLRAMAANVSYVPWRCLGSDVDPRAGCHLAVHRQTESSRRLNSSHVAHSGTSIEFEIRTRGAHSWVSKTPDRLARLDKEGLVAFQPAKLTHDRVVCLPRAGGLPRSSVDDEVSGRSATSGSRLFMSIRIAASCGQPRQVISAPRGERTSPLPARRGGPGGEVHSR